MSSVNFIGIGLAFFLSTLLVLKKKKGPFDFILMIWLLLNGLNLFFYHLNFIGKTEDYVPILIAMGLIPYLVSPLLYIYVSSLVQGNKFRWLLQLLHLTPFFIMLFSIWWFYFNSGEGYSISVSRGFINVRGNLPFVVRHWSLIMAFSAFIYPLLCLFKLARHRSSIENEFSNKDDITLNWMRYWILIEIVGFWFSFIIIIMSDDVTLNYVTAFKFISGMIIGNIFVVGYFGVRQSNIFVGSDYPESHSIEKEKYKTSSIDVSKAEQLMGNLKILIAEKKLYRIPTLSAHEVAEELDISKHQLSQLINQQLQKNFYEFINQYRIEEFKIRVLTEEAERLTLLGLAFDCGFNSKSTFNHLFKKSEGITPSQYRKKVIQ